MVNARIVLLIGMASTTACGSDVAPRQDAKVATPTLQVDAQDANRPGWTNKVWKVTAPPDRAPGSVYLFLNNGTVVMTSCVETYRLATWTSEGTGRVTIEEDPQVRVPADIREVDERHLAIRLHLKSEVVELALETASVPFVCPDLKR